MYGRAERLWVYIYAHRDRWCIDNGEWALFGDPTRYYRANKHAVCPPLSPLDTVGITHPPAVFAVFGSLCPPAVCRRESSYPVLYIRFQVGYCRGVVARCAWWVAQSSPARVGERGPEVFPHPCLPTAIDARLLIHNFVIRNNESQSRIYRTYLKRVLLLS